MLCTNCASPAFCKIIACFHTPLIKKGKKNELLFFFFFARPSQTSTRADWQGAAASRLTSFAADRSHWWAERGFLAQKTWARSKVQAPVPTSRPQSPAPHHHHVPADGDKCHWPPAGEGWDSTKRPSAWGQRNQICVVGVTASSWGGNGKLPLAEGHRSVGDSTLGRASTRGCPLVIF